MIRYLLLVLAVYAVFWVLRSERRAALRRRASADAAKAARSAAASAAPHSPHDDAARATGSGLAGTAIAGEDIVGCAYCDLHLPVSEAILSSATSAGDDAVYYCSEAHRLAALREAEGAPVGGARKP